MQRTITSIQSMYHFEPLSELALIRYSISQPDFKFEFESEDGKRQVDFVLKLMELYSNPEAFNSDEFDEFSLHLILEYLERTHDFYLVTMLPKMEQAILGIVKLFPDHTITKLLNQFFLNYKRELEEHIAMEEQLLFPYARTLAQGGSQGSYSVGDFQNEHSMQVEDALVELVVLLEHDFPEVVRSFAYRSFKNLLEQFQLDIHIHHLIEEEVFLNKLEELEKRPNGFPFQ